MKRFLFSLFPTLLAFPMLSYAQSGITTDQTAPYNTIQYLIEDVLSDGSANITNITYTFGDLGQVGYFTDANTSNPIFGYPEGLFLSSRGSDLLESNNAGTAYTGNPSPYQDPELDQSLQDLFGTSYSLPLHDQQNVVVIEFDIVANLDYFEFIYSFASREYQSFTCSNFNDVFGFYVSGPDPANPGTPYSNKNIALIPTDLTQTSFTNTAVAINSLNSGIDNAPANCILANANWEQDSIFFNNNYSASPIDFHFTGYTIPLRAYVPAICNQTYHMKLAICDVSDTGLGSAVMLQKNSLRSPIDVAVEPAPNVYPDTNGWFYEGCGTTTIKFRRPTVPDFAPGTGDLKVPFSLSGTATYGDDYVFLNNNGITDYVIIPNNEEQFILNVDPISDGLVENPNEMVKFTIPPLTGVGCNGDLEIDIEIADYPELIVELVDERDSYCPGDEVEFEVSVSGCIQQSTLAPYSIHWSQIGFNPKQTVSPDSTTTYFVEVHDLCPEQKIRDSVVVNVNIWPELVFDKLEDEQSCDELARHYGILEGKIEGGDGNYTYSWLNLETNKVESTQEDPLLFPGEYEVTVIDGCENFDKRKVEILHYELPEEEILHLELSEERTFELKLNEFPVNANFAFMYVTYTWDFGDGSAPVVSKGPLTHTFPEFGHYTVTVRLENEIGCIKTFTKNIEVTPFFNIPTIFTPNGDGVNEGFKAYSSRQYSSFEMIIYDRWGKEVFSSDNIEDKWFGKTKEGEICSEGMYVYHLKVKYPNYDDEKVHEGYIHLTR